MGIPRQLFWMVGLAVLACATTPAPAQVDAFAEASHNCVDERVALESRLKNCNLVVNAKGVEPDDMAFAYVGLGVVYQEQNNDDAALTAFSNALTFAPSLWQGLVNRAFLYLRRGEVDLALADYKTVNSTDPNAAVVNLPNTGEYRPLLNGEFHNYDSPERDRGVRDGVISKLRDAVATALSQRCLTRAASAKGPEGALADCNTALEISPEFPVALASRGVVEFVRGDYRSAVKDLDNAPPNLAVPIYFRGIARHRLGDKMRGDADIAAAEKLKPGITAAMTAQGIAP